jgi:pimeloyl-ACP methyl ester carboxylesterase
MDKQQPSTMRTRILSSADRRQRVIPVSFQLSGIVLNLISLIHNEWASSVLERLWFSVFKSKPKPWVARFWQTADEEITLSVEDVTIPIYSWGQGPLIVLMHGWSGSGTQYRYFIPELVTAGFRVICFDAPEHGSNPGRKTDMIRFSASLIAIQKLLGPIDTVIAHSLGAMATTFALQRGLQAQRVVLVAPHLEVQKMFETYRDLLSIRPALAQRFHDKIGRKMKSLMNDTDPWTFLTPDVLLGSPDLRGMLVFDHEDPEVSAAQFEQMDSIWQHKRLYTTRGRGHNRILKDADVVLEVVEYLKD